MVSRYSILHAVCLVRSLDHFWVLDWVVSSLWFGQNNDVLVVTACAGLLQRAEVVLR